MEQQKKQMLNFRDETDEFNIKYLIERTNEFYEKLLELDKAEIEEIGMPSLTYKYEIENNYENMQKAEALENVAKEIQEELKALGKKTFKFEIEYD